MGNAHAGRVLPARIQGWVAAAGSACQGSPTGARLHWLNLNIPGHRHTASFNSSISGEILKHGNTEYYKSNMEYYKLYAFFIAYTPQEEII